MKNNMTPIDLNLSAPAKGFVCARCGKNVIRYMSKNFLLMDSEGLVLCANGQPHTIDEDAAPVGTPNPGPTYFDTIRKAAEEIRTLATGRTHPTIHDKIMAQVELITTYATELELQWEEENGND